MSNLSLCIFALANAIKSPFNLMKISVLFSYLVFSERILLSLSIPPVTTPCSVIILVNGGNLQVRLLPRTAALSLILVTVGVDTLEGPLPIHILGPHYDVPVVLLCALPLIPVPDVAQVPTHTKSNWLRCCLSRRAIILSVLYLLDKEW